MALSRSVVVAVTALATGVVAGTSLRAQQSAATPIADRYRANATRLPGAALSDSAAYNRLARLTDTFDHRLDEFAKRQAEARLKPG